jgi:hypothetical protein
MTAAQVELEMGPHPLRRVQHHRLSRQHVLIFELSELPGPKSPSDGPEK